MAIDKEPDPVARLLTRPDINILQLTTQTVSFEQLQLPKQVNLINASFSLPFVPQMGFLPYGIKFLTL